MNPHDSHSGEDTRLNAVLEALAATPTPSGMEQRILRRVAAAEVTNPSRWSVGRARATLHPARLFQAPRIGFAVLAVAAVLGGAASMHFLHPRSGPPPHEQWGFAAPVPARVQALKAPDSPDNAVLPSSAPATEMAGKAGSDLNRLAANALSAHRAVSTQRSGCAAEACAHRLQLATVDTVPQQSGAPERERSYPAPPMPLTEQERSLLAVAQRNDPVTIAMLDPVERELRQVRERAETEKFFAPAKLPDDLQQEIRAAVRSQYVNTPPPPELAGQEPTDSSLHNESLDGSH